MHFPNTQKQAIDDEQRFVLARTVATFMINSQLTIINPIISRYDAFGVTSLRSCVKLPFVGCVSIFPIPLWDVQASGTCDHTCRLIPTTSDQHVAGAWARTNTARTSGVLYADPSKIPALDLVKLENAARIITRLFTQAVEAANICIEHKKQQKAEVLKTAPTPGRCDVKNKRLPKLITAKPGKWVHNPATDTTMRFQFEGSVLAVSLGTALQTTLAVIQLKLSELGIDLLDTAHYAVYPHGYDNNNAYTNFVIDNSQGGLKLPTCTFRRYQKSSQGSICEIYTSTGKVIKASKVGELTEEDFK